MPRRSLVIASLLTPALLAATYGCDYFSPPLEKQTRSLTHPHQQDSGIRVTTKNGSVTIEQSDTTEVLITAKIKARGLERLDQVQIITTTDPDGYLNIHAQWPGGSRLNSESCSFIISLPDAIGIDITTDNGAITTSGLAGQATLYTDNGSIQVSNHQGPVDAETDNGAIIISSTPFPIKATTDNGSVKLTDVTTPVEVRSDNGSVHIQLAANSAGPVHAYTDNGSITLIVSSSFNGKLNATTNHGQVNIDGLNVNSTSPSQSISNKSVSLDLGDAQWQSNLKSDNGDITIRQVDEPTPTSENNTDPPT